MKYRKAQALIDATLLGIGHALGVPVLQFFNDLDTTDKGKRGQQSLGEFCGGSCLDECGVQFGEGLAQACRTCPN